MDLDERARLASVDLRQHLGERNLELGLQQIHDRMRRRRGARVLSAAAASIVAVALVAGLLWSRAGSGGDGQVLAPARPCAASGDPVVTRLMVGGSTVTVERVSGGLELRVDGAVISSTPTGGSNGSRGTVQVHDTAVVWGFSVTRPTHATVTSTDGTANSLTVAYMPDAGSVFVGPVAGSPDLGTLALSGNSPAPVCR
jgi:hypothetical protein